MWEDGEVKRRCVFCGWWTELKLIQYVNYCFAIIVDCNKKTWNWVLWIILFLLDYFSWTILITLFSLTWVTLILNYWIYYLSAFKEMCCVFLFKCIHLLYWKYRNIVLVKRGMCCMFFVSVTCTLCRVWLDLNSKLSGLIWLAPTNDSRTAKLKVPPNVGLEKKKTHTPVGHL